MPIALCVPAAIAAAEPDLFYTDLLVRGREARLAGEVGAARMLRIACFGYLETPTPLAECLVELALAQTLEGDAAGFSETVGRLIEVENRFGAFQQASLETATFDAFQAELIARTPGEVLESVPAFRAAAVQKRATRLANLEPAARRAELERLAALEPETERWRYELGLVVLEEGDPRRALEILESLPAPLAGCRRAEARATVGACSDADREAVWCRESAPRSVWLARIRCWINAGDFSAASRLLTTLPSRLSGDKALRQLRRVVERRLRRQSPQPGADQAPLIASATDSTSRNAAVTISAPESAGDTMPPAKVPAEAADPPQSSQGLKPPANAVSADSVASSAPTATAAASLITAIEGSRARLGAAANEAEVLALLDDAHALLGSYPDAPEVRLHIGEIYYRLRRWNDSVSAIQAAGVNLDGRPALHFYYAVALYESGERTAAVAALERALPKIRRTEFVREYVIKILGRDPG